MTAFPNDYDTGIPFWPQRQDEKTWYAFYDAYKFEEMLSKQQQKIVAKGLDGVVASFKQFFKRLDPDDNPVLVVVKLK